MLFVGLGAGVVVRVAERKVAAHEQAGLVVPFVDTVVEIDIGVRAEVLAASDTGVSVLSEVAAPARHTHLIGVVRGADDGRLALAQQQIREDVRVVAEVVLKEMLCQLGGGVAVGGVAVVEPTFVLRNHVRAQRPCVFTEHAFLAVFL